MYFWVVRIEDGCCVVFKIFVRWGGDEKGVGVFWYFFFWVVGWLVEIRYLDFFLFFF